MKGVKLFLALISLLCLQTVFAANAAVGYWKTIDDVTGKPKAIVQMTETSNQTLMGRILKIWPSPGFDQNELCTACSGAKHNQRIVGMVILTGLRQDPQNANRWINGNILDPKNGKVYRSNLQVMDGGRSLQVRGYIGVPLFGRSQTWLRVNSSTSN